MNLPKLPALSALSLAVALAGCAGNAPKTAAVAPSVNS